MIVKENPDMEHVAVGFYQASEDAAIRYQCEARQLWLEEQAGRERYHENIRKNYMGAMEKLSETKEQLEETKEELSEAKEELSEAKEELSETKKKLAAMEAELEFYRRNSSGNASV